MAGKQIIVKKIKETEDTNDGTRRKEKCERCIGKNTKCYSEQVLNKKFWQFEKSVNFRLN
jgi:hypothetical protein